jgi:pimeloyl-ACP methyl ester carboxylesterase
MRAIRAAVLLAGLSAAPAFGEEMVSLPTRDGVTQAYLLVAPEGGIARGVAILFPGGAGVIRLRGEGGRTRFGPNGFPVRSRGEFARRGIVAAVVDAPSDQQAGMSDDFRAGRDHAKDIEGVLNDLRKRFPSLPVYLVGTSRGTVSAAYLGKAMGAGVAGVVITSAVYLPAGKGAWRKPGLSEFDFASLQSRVLIVHHQDDGCRFTPYSEARELAQRFPLITVKGGKPAVSDACEALSEHGFFGKEPETVEAISRWMLGEPFPKMID